MSRENNINESTATGTLLPGAGEAWKYAKAGAKNDWKSIKGDFKKGMPGFKKDLKKKIKSAKKTGKQALNWAKSKLSEEELMEGRRFNKLMDKLSYKLTGAPYGPRTKDLENDDKELRRKRWIENDQKRLKRNAKARARKEAKKGIKNYPATGVSVPKSSTGWQKKLPKALMEAIVNKDYMLAEKLFNEHMEAIAEMRVKAKKQEVAKKIGQSPFSPSMKHYKQQIRAAVKKMKAQTKIVDGPEKTVRHIHEENLNEVSKIKARKALSASEDPEYENYKDSKRDGPLAYDLKQRIKNKWGTKELRKAEFKSDSDNYGKETAKKWARVNSWARKKKKLTGKAKVSAKE